jgi:hypothetical protein
MGVMVEIGIAEYFGMAEALGIIAAVFVVVYYSRKQMQALSIDIETKILNDLDEKLHGITQIGVQQPELIKVISNVKSDWTPEVAFSYHILYTLAHAFHMRQRKVLSDNEWTGWLRWMRAAFQEGTIAESWKENIEGEKWFDPAFQKFIDSEVMTSINKKNMEKH